MKIALGCNNFPPEFQGGTERVTLALARALHELGHDVVVITGSEQPHRGEDVEREDGLGVPVCRIRRLPGEVYGLNELVRPRVLAVVESVLLSERVDVLHLHHWANLSIDVLRMARRHGIVSVATLHDMWTACPRFFRRPPESITCPEGDGREPCGRCVKLTMDAIPLWGLRLGVANRDRELRGELEAASAVCVPSRSSADAIAAHVPWGGPIEVVPHGLLEPPRAPTSGNAEPRTPFRVGTFGNLVQEKGVSVLVEAMAGVPAELHLFGPFLVQGYEREVRELAARSSVELLCHGSYDPEGRHPARELDLAVFPSLCQETYGLVVEEALARGVPVVVADAGALPERIGDGGIVTRPGDVEALRAVLLEVVTSRQRYRSLVDGVPSEFAVIADAAGRYLELYQAAMEVPT